MNFLTFDQVIEFFTQNNTYILWSTSMFYGCYNSLKEACISGNISVVKGFYDHGIEGIPNDWKMLESKDIRVGGHIRKTKEYINIAAMNGNLEIVKYLIEKGDSYREVFAISVGYNHMNIVDHFLDSGLVKDVNDRSLEFAGVSPLNVACYNGNIDIIDKLLCHGAILNKKSAEYMFEKNDDATVLQILRLFTSKGINIDANISKSVYILVRKGLVQSFEYLASIRVNLNKKSKFGLPIMYALFSNNASEIVKIFLDNGFGNFVDGNNMTLLHEACMIDNAEIAENIVKYFIAKEKNIDERNNFGYTPLHYACLNKAKNFDKVANCIIMNGTNVNNKSNFGDTVLHYICRNETDNSLKVIGYLIANGANINERGQYDYTPLRIATTFCSKEIIEFLKVNGAHQ